MTLDCRQIRERLDDWVDGTLGAADRQRVGGHLEGCSECRGELAALERLHAESSRLPREIRPPRDLWPAIESRLERRSSWWRRLLPPAGPNAEPWPATPLLAALAGMLAVTLGVWLWRSQPAPVPAPAPPAAEAAASRFDPALASRAELARSEDGMLLAHRDLLEAVERRRSQLSPETLAVLEENVQIIDQAIGRIRSALEEDPLNPRLTRQLAAQYRREVHLLRQVSGV